CHVAFLFAREAGDLLHRLIETNDLKIDSSVSDQLSIGECRIWRSGWVRADFFRCRNIRSHYNHIFSGGLLWLGGLRRRLQSSAKVLRSVRGLFGIPSISVGGTGECLIEA